MTIPASTVPAAKAWLFTAITAQINDPTVQVVYDEPGTYENDDIIMVGDVRRTPSPLSMVGTMGAYALQEDYEIDVVVSVYRGGDNAQTVYERACTLANTVEYVVRNDPTLGGAVPKAIPSVGDMPRTQWTENKNGLIAEFRIPIRCLAVI